MRFRKGAAGLRQGFAKVPQGSVRAVGCRKGALPAVGVSPDPIDLMVRDQ